MCAGRWGQQSRCRAGRGGALPAFLFILNCLTDNWPGINIHFAQIFPRDGERVGESKNKHKFILKSSFSLSSSSAQLFTEPKAGLTGASGLCWSPTSLNNICLWGRRIQALAHYTFTSDLVSLITHSTWPTGFSILFGKKRIATAEHKTRPVMLFAGARIHVIGTVFNIGPYVNQKKINK